MIFSKLEYQPQAGKHTLLIVMILFINLKAFLVLHSLTRGTKPVAPQINQDLKIKQILILFLAHSKVV